MKDMLPKLDYWKRYASLGGKENFEGFKKQIIDEFNELHIEGMPKVESLNALAGNLSRMVSPESTTPPTKLVVSKCALNKKLQYIL